jgi:hypothetical protein
MERQYVGRQITYYQKPADIITGFIGQGCGLSYHLGQNTASMPAPNYVHYFSSVIADLGPCPFICFQMADYYVTTNAYDTGTVSGSVQ